MTRCLLPRRRARSAARRSRGGERGLSLIEALIAMALLLLVAIGILPLFTRAMVNNAAGSEATQAANHARQQLEELGQLPFNNDVLAIAAGNQLLTEDAYFSGDQNRQGDEFFAAAGAGNGFELWDRTTRVRQFGMRGVVDDDADNVIDGLVGLEDDNDDGEIDSPLAAGTDVAFVHFKELSVELASPRDDPSGARGPGPLGAAPAYRVRTFKSF
jgi:type II secretory pathway pseudopilin PulG